MLNPLYLPELREMLADNDRDGLREFCTALHAARTAEFMEALDASEAWQVLQYAEAPGRAEIFGYFDSSKQIEIVETSDRREIGELIADLPPDDRVDLLNEIDPQVFDELMPLVPFDERRDIMRLRSYPEETAGALMTTEFARLSETYNAAEGLEELGRQAEELETIYYIYILDDEDHLHGTVSARQLVSSLGKPDIRIGELMERDLVTVLSSDDQEDVAEKVARYDLLAIPVVDQEHHMLGIITHDDVIDVVREEATEDAHRLSAVDPLEEGYLETHLLTLTWKRGIWLVVLAIGALLTAVVLRAYHVELAEWAWLVLFVPLVISSGGNTGSQSATLVITALTTGDVTLADWGRIIRREIVLGLCFGGLLAVIGYVAAIFLAPADGTSALVIPITLVLVTVFGALLGATLPLVFRWLGWDPALMSNPVIAGIIDIVGIIIFMQVAQLLLSAEKEAQAEAAFNVQSNIEHRLPDVHLQDLALHFDRADQDPDLVLGELFRITAGQCFEFLGHRRVLVGCGLDSQPHLLPRVGQYVLDG